MADFLGNTLQSIMNPVNTNFQPAVSSGIQSMFRNQALEQQQQQALDSRARSDAGAQAQAIRNQPPELRRQAMQGLAASLDGEGRAVVESMLQMDDVTLDATLQEIILESGGSISGGAPRKTATLSPGQRLVDATTGSEIASAVVDTTADTKLSNEIRKETRGRIGTELKDISRQSGVIKQNFDKVTNLAKEVAKGNRISATQALVALVKLGDPGSVVSGNEVSSALNAPNPLAALTEMLTSKGVSGDVIQAVSQRIDPLNPKNINTKDLLSTANALLSANIPIIQARFSEAKDQGEGNLSERGFKSLFSKGLEDRITGLSGLITVDNQQAQGQQVEQTATNPQTGERLVLRNGQWQPL